MRAERQSEISDTLQEIVGRCHVTRVAQLRDEIIVLELSDLLSAFIAVLDTKPSPVNANIAMRDSHD